MGKDRVVIQGYGLEECRVQALYAAWSVLAHRGATPLSVHVYTDKPEFFSPLAGAGLEVRLLTADEIRLWRGPCAFVHRLKAEMIREMVRAFPDDKLLYLDADVFAVSSMEQVFQRIGVGRAVMHEREYSVATRNTEQIRRFRRGLRRLDFHGKRVDLTADMWNAGAIGMDSSQFALVDTWIAFIDELYPRYSRGLVEQYGISLLLQRAASVEPCDDVVFHYWAQKDDYLTAILRELEVLRSSSWDAAAAHLRGNRLALPPPGRRKHRISVVQRLARALRLSGAPPR
jgi:hypothetical protein